MQVMYVLDAARRAQPILEQVGATINQLTTLIDSLLDDVNLSEVGAGDRTRIGRVVGVADDTLANRIARHLLNVPRSTRRSFADQFTAIDALVSKLVPFVESERPAQSGKGPVLIAVKPQFLLENTFANKPIESYFVQLGAALKALASNLDTAEKNLRILSNDLAPQLRSEYAENAAASIASIPDILSRGRTDYEAAAATVAAWLVFEQDFTSDEHEIVLKFPSTAMSLPEWLKWLQSWNSIFERVASESGEYQLLGQVTFERFEAGSFALTGKIPEALLKPLLEFLKRGMDLPAAEARMVEARLKNLDSARTVASNARKDAQQGLLTATEANATAFSAFEAVGLDVPRTLVIEIDGRQLSPPAAG